MSCERGRNTNPNVCRSSVELVEEPDRVLAAISCEVAVVTVDHRQARAHVAGEVEAGDAGSQLALFNQEQASHHAARVSCRLYVLDSDFAEEDSPELAVGVPRRGQDGGLHDPPASTLLSRIQARRPAPRRDGKRQANVGAARVQRVP
jgi:hypothetical protein